MRIKIHRNAANAYVIVFSTIDTRMSNSWKTKTAQLVTINTNSSANFT